MAGELAIAIRSLATCGFNSHIVSKPRFEVRQASDWPKKTGNTTRETLVSVVAVPKNCPLGLRCPSSRMVESQASATHILGFFNVHSRRPRRSPKCWSPLFRFASRMYCSTPVAPDSAIISLGSNTSAIWRYSTTFSATASNWPLRARRRISSVVSNTFGLNSITRFKSTLIRLSQIAMAALASFRLTSATRLSEIARRHGALVSAGGQRSGQPAPGPQHEGEGVASRTDDAAGFSDRRRLTVLHGHSPSSRYGFEFAFAAISFPTTNEIRDSIATRS